AAPAARGGAAPVSPDDSTSDAGDDGVLEYGGDEGESDDADVHERLDLDVRPGVEQLTIVGATPGDAYFAVGEVNVEIGDDGRLSTRGTFVDLGGGNAGPVDVYGSLVIRNLPDASPIYLVRMGGGFAGPFDVLARDEHPDASFYDRQQVGEGFGYLETRDGTLLSVNVRLPGPVEDGPYPTVVEYSGYTPSDPDATGLADLFGPLGYAYVGVNMRGSGCSGGSYRFFEYTQSTDGYDVIETVAAQPWSAKVGMVGVSFPGISQLFVAQTQPPNLAAITPLSVLDDSYRSTLYPGGILNTGFAVQWTGDREDDAEPAVDPDGELTGLGQGWASDRIAAGDEVCAANQSLRLQSPELVDEIADTPFYDSAVGDDIAPALFVDRIEVPTLMAGAWQDEQTGGRFPTMIPNFTGTDQLFVSLVNGLHTESISPAIYPRFVEFLDLYVAERTPDLTTARAIGPILAGGIFGTTDIGDPPDRFTGLSLDDARSAFEGEPPIHVHFEQGAAEGAEPLAPLPRFTERFDAWPIPQVEPTRWYLGADGSLTTLAPAAPERTAYRAVPDSIAETFWDGNSSDLWRTDVAWDWQAAPDGTVAGFTTAPLDETVVLVGTASADLWVNSSSGDTDLEVTLVEVRPDGSEIYIQSGWLRASRRALDDAASTELQPIHTQLQSDAEPLPEFAPDDVESAELVLARVEIFPFAHVVRPGSQIRLEVDAPGGNRAVWEFDTIAAGEAVYLGTGGDEASSLVLPVIPGVEVPATPPAPDSLRGQPSR
ncbi:MAG: CocE/NonD family hydrolase, partial [Actinomycetota bacterium]